MMKVFVDANILVSVINKEYPTFTHTSRIISLHDNARFQIFTSPICLAIAFYFAEKKSKATVAKKKIALLSENILIAAATSFSVASALANPRVNDFGDGLEYYSAIENGCTCIVTEDVDDFYFSDIEVLSSQSFFNKYLAVKKV